MARRFESPLAKKATRPASHPGESTAEPGAWWNGLPVFSTTSFTLRELVADDAPALLAHLSSEDVSRFIAPMPATIQGFERFITEARRDREAGTAFCYGIVPAGAEVATGLIQVRAIEADFATADWSFALGSAYWGSNLFALGARLVLSFAFETVGVLRLEARASVMNGRGNGALRKTGAVQEGVLRRSFQRDGQYHDQVLWSILAEDWRLQHTVKGPLVH